MEISFEICFMLLFIRTNVTTKKILSYFFFKNSTKEKENSVLQFSSFFYWQKKKYIIIHVFLKPVGICNLPIHSINVKLKRKTNDLRSYLL